MKLPNTLFVRTASTLFLSLLLLSIVFVASTAYFVIVPVGKRSADDLSALLVLAAKTWVELPPETRPDLVDELKTAHGILLMESEQPLEVGKSIPIYIYLRFLKSSLQHRFGKKFDITLGVDKNQPDWVWINIPNSDKFIRFGISVQRIGARPPVALFAMAIAILVLAIGTALILARRMTKPLEVFSKATSMVGRGNQNPLPENRGPEEIMTLARNFNRMSQEVTELLENRTTLLAGISHDLRTPLTRLRLALEINSATTDTEFRSQLENNIEEMEELLDQSLLLARGINKKEVLIPVDLVKLLATLAFQLEAHCQQQQAQQPCRISFEADPAIGTSLIYSVPEQGLLRILRNLLNNALRYGSDQPVSIHLSLQLDDPVITIQDRGPGIPEQERLNVFRPFYRLEQSRNLKTGGSGLGLAIVQQLSLAIGWEISMHARTGGGNTARLWLKNTA